MTTWKYWDIGNVDLNQYDYRTNEPDLKDEFGHSIQGDYFQGYQAIHQYVYDVLTGVRLAGRSEIAACERFVFDLQREDLFYDHEEVDFIILIANTLKHPKQALKGKPFYLLGWMQFILGNMAGWYYSDKARDGLIGSRRFQFTFFAVARANSKTVLAVAAAIYFLITTQNGSPIATCSAPSSGQSRIAFNDMKEMIATTGSKSIRNRFQSFANEIRIKGGGRIFPTSKNAGRLDGHRITFALCDEIHEHPDSSIVDVLATGMSASKDPMLLMITTAGVDTQSYGRQVMAEADETAKGIFKRDRFFAVVYAMDDEDADNWHDEKLWEKANPSLGHAVSLENVRTHYTNATANAKQRANFLTKYCNIWVDFDEASFVEASDLFDCKDKSLSINNFKGKPCYLGLDLAGVSDLSSLVYIFPDKQGGIDVFQKSYLPESAMHKEKPSIQDRYYTAQKSGDLIFTIGEVTDFDYIKEDIRRAYEEYDVKALSIDAAAGAIRFANELEELGIEAVSVKQGFGLSESAVLLQSLVKSGKFRYSSDLLEWCFVNALQREGAYGDIAIIRPKNDKSKKIDICVSTAIGLSQTILQEKTPEVNIRFF
ncbi:terminase large subunit [Aeromonas veronii]|uniref:terminase large subunit n=1 Tax=Aeromonas veronii TaxID=654 RepID=UPI003D1C7A4E